MHLRIHSVAAFLRCIYASIEFAPTTELKTTAINNIRGIESFRSITQLCDSTGWSEDANIAAKYLRIARHVISVPLQGDRASEQYYPHYEIVGIVIRKVMT